MKREATTFHGDTAQFWVFDLKGGGRVSIPPDQVRRMWNAEQAHKQFDGGAKQYVRPASGDVWQGKREETRGAVVPPVRLENLDRSGEKASGDTITEPQIDLGAIAGAPPSIQPESRPGLPPTEGPCAEGLTQDTDGEGGKPLSVRTSGQGEALAGLGLHPDTRRLDWLNEQIVNVIDLDDGRIIDVRGLDVRRSIDTAMGEPESRPGLPPAVGPCAEGLTEQAACECPTGKALKAAQTMMARLYAQVAALRRELFAERATSESRHDTCLMRLSDERATEWTRAENAEAERDSLRSLLDEAREALAESDRYCSAIENNCIRMDIAMSTGDARRDLIISATQQRIKHAAVLARIDAARKQEVKLT